MILIINTSGNGIDLVLNDKLMHMEAEKQAIALPVAVNKFLKENNSYSDVYEEFKPVMFYELVEQAIAAKANINFLNGIDMHSKWFANGAATKKMYLTVSHTDNGGMNFSYHYQTVKLGEKDMELLYYYMMRILFMGISNPDMKIGEIIDAV